MIRFVTLERALAGPMDRRRFLILGGALAGAAAFCQTRGDLAHAGPPLRDYPFTLGVASGDPTPSRAVLWTRLAPDIYAPDGGMPHRRVPVKWRVAKDPGCAASCARGSRWRRPSWRTRCTWSCRASTPGASTSSSSSTATS